LSQLLNSVFDSPFGCIKTKVFVFSHQYFFKVLAVRDNGSDLVSVGFSTAIFKGSDLIDGTFNLKGFGKDVLSKLNLHLLLGHPKQVKVSAELLDEFRETFRVVVNFVVVSKLFVFLLDGHSFQLQVN